MTEEKKICEYLEVLSSKAPIPGGGGASALAGGLENHAAGILTFIRP